MFLSKAFSISEMDIHQNMRLKYYKKIQEWWTDDEDGECINSNLYRNTENSKVLLKDGEEISERKSTIKFINNVFIYKR